MQKRRRKMTADARFTLAGHVDADITAPGSLQAPAKIKVDRLIAHIAKPYSYEMKSAARDGLIRLAPLPPKPALKTGRRTEKKMVLRSAYVTLSRFDYGQYAPGSSLHLTDGAGQNFARKQRRRNENGNALSGPRHHSGYCGDNNQSQRRKRPAT